MLPSRGLRLRPRPVQFIHPASRQPLSAIGFCNAPRKFSSIPRTSSTPIISRRAGLLPPAHLKIGIIKNPSPILTTSFVRNASWYAPWSWGKSSTPSKPLDSFPTSEMPAVEPVTSQTPELAPAGIDTPPVVDSIQTTSAEVFDDPMSVEELLSLDPVKDTLPVQLIDHAGQLKELGLDYGFGMATVVEKVIETIYLTSGWGWAGSIVATGAIFRCVAFFFQAQSSHRMAAIAALRPVTAPIQAKMEEAIARGDKQQADLYRSQQSIILKPYVGSFMSMGGFMVIQAYIGFSAFRVLRAMGELPVPGMNQDGFLWFADLTSRDPYFLLPLATASLMWTIFRSGGETGVSNEMGSANSRKQVVSIMAVVFGVITAFQPAALQLYFLNAAILGGGTGYLLRQNEFRRLIGIRRLPTQASNDAYTKVVNGQMNLKDIRGPDGKFCYQAPTPVESRSVATLSGIRVKSGTSLPLHLRPDAPKINLERPDRDYDYHEGPKGSLTEKLSWYRRNYRLKFIFRRLKESLAATAKRQGYVENQTLTDEQLRRKKKAEQYEVERQRRLQNRM